MTKVPVSATTVIEDSGDFINKYKFFTNENMSYSIHYGANIYEGDAREFRLHHHSNYEIYIYIRGKANFYIEGTIFALNPYDIVIIPPYTLHRPQPEVGEFFERYVINIHPDFFQNMLCEEFKDIFSDNSDKKYKISGNVVRRSNMLNIIEFLLGVSDMSVPYIKPLVRTKIVELLYHINTVNNFEDHISMNTKTQEIIAYIDENFRTITDVESITNNFYYSKNHIGYLFKKHTGITITKYLNIKRLENVEKLYRQGYSLVHSCIESGFSSYDSFAYTYKKEYGKSPKNGVFSKNPNSSQDEI